MRCTNRIEIAVAHAATDRRGAGSHPVASRPGCPASAAALPAGRKKLRAASTIYGFESELTLGTDIGQQASGCAIQHSLFDARGGDRYVWNQKRTGQGQKGGWLPVALALLSQANAAPCWAGVFAINDNGALSNVPSIDATPPAALAAFGKSAAGIIGPATLTPLAETSAPAHFAAVTADAAAANGLAPDLLSAVIWQESHWRPAAVSRAGAVGLAQLMPSTAGAMRVDPRDPVASLYGAARYLKQQLDRFNGNVELALAAYNAGPTRVVQSGGVPAIRETRDYVTSVMNRLSATVNKDN